MVFTLLEVLAILTFIFVVLTYINDIYKKKYPPRLANLGGYFFNRNLEATVIGALRYYYSIKMFNCQPSFAKTPTDFVSVGAFRSYFKTNLLINCLVNSTPAAPSSPCQVLEWGSMLRSPSYPLA